MPDVRERSAKPVGHDLSFASINVCSLSPSKLDNLLLELNIMLLSETDMERCRFTCRRRPSNECYDDTCRSAKRHLRSLERASCTSCWSTVRYNTTGCNSLAYRASALLRHGPTETIRIYWTARNDSERLYCLIGCGSRLTEF